MSEEQIKPLTQYLQRRSKIGAPPSRNGIQQSRRIHRSLASFSQRVADVLTEIFKIRSDISPIVDPSAGADINNEEWLVVVGLRVLQENLAVVLTRDIVRHIATALNVKTNDHILTEPDEEELTAISYLVVMLLSDQRIIPGHTVYLTSVRVFNRNLNRTEYLAQLAGKQSVQLDVKLAHAEYSVLFGAAESFFQRVQRFARLAPLDPDDRHLIKNVRSKCAVTVNLGFESLQDLLDIQPGKRIRLCAKNSATSNDELTGALSSGVTGSDGGFKIKVLPISRGNYTLTVKA